MALDKIKFFGDADRKGKSPYGRISSEYPAWYLDTHISEMESEAGELERRLEMGGIPLEEIPRTKADIKRIKERMTIIIKSKPKLTAKDKDLLGDIYKELSQQISDSMFRETEMKKGLVSAHEEVKRMKQPIIDIGKCSPKMLENMGIIHTDGKLSRDQATKVWKIAGKLLGEITNVEYLRKDYNFGTYQSERSLAEVEMG